MSIEDKLQEIEELCTALADGTRLRLLNLMRDDEVCVCFFTEVLGESQPKISRHLAFLRKCGIVETRRDGKWMHYRISVPEDAYKAAMLNEALSWLWSNEEMREEYEELARVCCAVNPPVTIARAPKPETLAEPERVFIENDELETYLL